MATTLRTRVDHLEIARHYARNAHLWTVQPQFDAANRWLACLADDPDAQIWLMTWLPGQRTDLHDHGGSTGAFVVVSGALTEEIATPNRFGVDVRTDVVSGRRPLRRGAGRAPGDEHVPQPGDQRALLRRVHRLDEPLRAGGRSLRHVR